MAVVVNWKWRAFVGSITWRGRCCGVTLNDIDRSASFFLCSVHAAHDELHASSLCDAVWLIKQRPVSSIPFLFGDLNCDLLPTFPNDPFVGDPNRMQHHVAERRNLHEVLESCSMYVARHNVHSFPKGYAELLPFTRVPLGDQKGLPSFIDFVCPHNTAVECNFDVV